MSRQKIAAGNWKMNLTLKKGKELVDKLIKGKRDPKVLTILGVPFTHLDGLQNHLKYVDNIKISAQNCHEQTSGAFTGEVSPQMIKALGVSYVILGHSERRQYFNENNKLLKAKVDNALAAGLKIIFCCGEPLKERKTKNHLKYVRKQIKDGLYHLSAKDMSKVVIAYEPIWAIGTGETASPEQAQEMHLALRKSLNRKFGEISNDISILYGGSVKPTNAKELFSQADIDGALVGGASLKADNFLQIINSF